MFVDPVDLQSPFGIALGSGMYAVMRAALPGWAASWLPAPQEAAMAPVPPTKITAAQLKRALLQLSTPNMLSDAGEKKLPEGSPNLLIFNNYTSV